MPKENHIATPLGIVIINPDLIKSRGINEHTLELIKQAHRYKDELIKTMEGESDAVVLRDLADKVTGLEYYLQDLWGFEKNPNYHYWWEVPHCECPKFDNQERYPVGPYIINALCPIHGDS